MSGLSTTVSYDDRMPANDSDSNSGSTSDSAGKSGQGKRDEGAFWTILGYLLSGLLVWGGAGLLLDRWLQTGYLGVGGMLIGVTSAMYLIWLRFIKE